MSGFPQQCPQQYPDEDQFHGGSFRAIGGSWPRSETVSMSPQHSQSAPSPDHRPLVGQPWYHAGVLQDDIQFQLALTNAIGTLQVDRVGMRPSVEDPTVQGQQQDPQHRDHHIVPGYARVVEDVPIQAHVAPPAPAAGDPAPAIQDPVPNGRASEVLRQLALLYLNDPNSQLVMIRMGPRSGHADEVMVDFTLKLTNL